VAGFGWGVSERDNAGVLFQERAHDTALDALAATVDDADFINARANALLDILFNHAGYVLGRKGVDIYRVFYRKDYRLAKRWLSRVGGR